MKKDRRILFNKCMMVLGLILMVGTQAFGSVTKVGNGDDGADLESLTPITSGPILEARQRAIGTVKRLNVVGIPGMGLLIPELERSDLLMASKDVHPTGEQSGSLEMSADQGSVYARTFAEPYAATRFFPAAESLTSEQLVALHIHEALHRALPSDIRANEDKVMHLTMAMTSPGASYDRVQQVASLYMGPMSANVASGYSSEIKTTVSAPVELPPKSRMEFKYGVDMYVGEGNFYNNSVFNDFEFQTSLGGYRSLWSHAIEPVLRVRAKVFKKYEGDVALGVTSYDLEGRMRVDDQTVAGPLLRFTAKSLDEDSANKNERDIITVGGFYRNSGSDGYFESSLFYSLGSTAGSGYNSAKYNPILSYMGRTGLKWGHLFIGAVFDLHASEGREISASEHGMVPYDDGNYMPPRTSTTRSSFRLLAAGPEIGLEGRNVQFKIYAKHVLNSTTATFDDLGDLMDRGAGQGALGMSLSMAF